MVDEKLKKQLEDIGAKELSNGVFILEVFHDDECPKLSGGECICDARQ